MNNEEFKAALDQEKLFRLSGELGVSAESLYRLQIGWHPREMCFTFPCFGAPFGPNSLVGIERRYHDGKKKVIAGTSGGLFIPTGLSGSKREPLLIEEGASSTAALLDMGFDAIGRFNCNSGVALILAYISKMVGRSIVIVANADEQKFRPDGSSFYPGQDGGDILAAAAVELGHSVKRIVLPNHVNDSREFRKKGATKDMMLSVIRQWPVLTAEGCAA
jgi:hypothetical protein